ncbi:MAG: serine/threonine-protein kinase [Candidatus Eisenbacteria bacterium]|nr:serine/threonine-protein kinase [Candidatus Eisenbacteria bacterium]
MTLSPGTRLGPYEIVAPLGAGGMGEVYRARDPRLGRDVAIKVLPAEFARDEERMRRFTREARAAGSLQHPNIVTVFDIGTEGTVTYVVQELVPGGSLRDRLARGPVPLREALRLASGVAAGLAAAHEKGIVHRDLKPENVAIADEGRPQVLDFGLARVERSLDEATLTAQPTSAGMVIGTVGYMAPEQVRGEVADARSDVFALGTMLHEMLSGGRPFSRGSSVETLHAILHDEPPPLPPGVPSHVARVVSRCLEKDPRARFQSARDLAFALDLVAGGSPAAAAGSAAGATVGPPRTPAWIAVAAALALAAAGYAIGRLTAPRANVSTVRVSTLSQGTRDIEPGVAPDGRFVAFSSVRPGGMGIWITDMTSRSEVRLTTGADHYPRFTPDGGSVLYTRLERARHSLWRVPVLGGSPRLVIEDADDADIAPDGDRIAFLAGTSDSSGARAQLMLARSDGTARRELWSVGSVILANPRWSPDGRSIALILSGSQNNPGTLAIVDVGKGTVRRFASPNGGVFSSPAWDGSGHGIIVAEGEGTLAVTRGAAARLFRFDVRSGRFQLLGWLNEYPTMLDLLPDGRLVLSSLLVRQNLREVALSSRGGENGRWLTAGMAMDRQPVYAPDGRSVVFSSNRGGTLDLWELSLARGEMHRVTDDPADDWDPVVTRDGESIFWSSNRSGAFEVWSARRDGSSPRQVSRDSLDAENPGVSPDGRWIIYSSSNVAKSGLWRVGTDGGNAELLLRGITLIPDLSPDGRYASVILAVGTLEANLTVVDLESGRVLPSTVPLRGTPGTVQVGRSRWTPDSQALVYLEVRDDGHPVLLRRPLSAWRGEGGQADTLFAGSSDAIESFGFSPDGRHAVLSVVDWLSGLAITNSVPGVAPRRSAK